MLRSCFGFTTTREPGVRSPHAVVKRLSAWVTLALLVAACAQPPSAREQSTSAAGGERSAAPKRVTAVVMGEPPTLSVKINSAGAGGIIPGADAIEELVSAGLTHLDHNNVLHPQLAEAVPTVENGLWKVLPDGRMETTWKLHEHARWHDGTPVTTEDLLFTVRVAQDRELATFNHPGFESVESVEAADARTITVTWKRPYIQADSMFTSIFPSFALPLPKHLLEPTYLSDRAAFLDLPFWNQGYVGSGPYRLKEWVAGSHLLLEANEAYPLGRPKVDALEIKFIPDSSTLAANLLAGTVELTLGRTLSLEQGLQVRDQWGDRGAMAIRLSNWVVLYPQFISPNPSVVGNVQFRRALLHAIDRQEMVDAMLAGIPPVADNYVGPRAPEYPEIQDKIVRYPYDPQRAVQMIEGLGYTRGSDGTFRDAGGQQLALELRTTGDLDLHRKAILAVTDYWQRIGVAVEPVIIPIQRQRDREYRSQFPAFELLQQGNDLGSLVVLHGRETPLPENNWNGRNKARYRNPAFDTLIDRYFVTIDRTERMQVLGQIVNHTTDQLNVMGLFYQAAPTMVGNRLLNVGEYGERATPAWNAHEWDVRS
jgi:peptide/nickel transport system substrate-binding protein